MNDNCKPKQYHHTEKIIKRNTKKKNNFFIENKPCFLLYHITVTLSYFHKEIYSSSQKGISLKIKQFHSFEKIKYSLFKLNLCYKNVAK